MSAQERGCGAAAGWAESARIGGHLRMGPSVFGPFRYGARAGRVEARYWSSDWRSCWR